LGLVNDQGEPSFKDPEASDDVEVEDLLSEEEDPLKDLKGKNLNYIYNRPKTNNKGHIDEDGYFKRITQNEWHKSKWENLIELKKEYHPEKIKIRFEQQQ